MSSPEVSVVLPVKNGGEYLGDAVDSILEQSLTAIELLLVDDHSEDGTIDQLDQSDPRLSILRSPGNGVVAAFNHGMKLSQGRIIARMDADDISLPRRLETQLGFLQNNPDIEIAGACVEIISNQPLRGGNIHYQQWLNSQRTPEQIHCQMFVESPVPNPTAMLRRETLFRLDGYEDVQWPEDYDLFLRADRLGIRVGKPEATLLKWREHPLRLTRTDDRYSRAHFQQAKAYYLADGRIPNAPVIIWGAGPTGKKFHDLLEAQGCEVAGFINVHPRRVGGRKRGKPVWSADTREQWLDGFILAAVGSRGARVKISTFLLSLGLCEDRDYLFVA